MSCTLKSCVSSSSSKISSKSSLDIFGRVLHTQAKWKDISVTRCFGKINEAKKIHQEREKVLQTIKCLLPFILAKRKSIQNNINNELKVWTQFLGWMQQETRESMALQWQMFKANHKLPYYEQETEYFNRA